MKTTYISHFDSATGEALSLIKAERGLALNLFLAVKALAEAKGLDNLLTEYDKEMLDAEARVKQHLDEGVTLSEACPAWKARKSAIRGALKRNTDPTKFDTYKKFVEANKKTSTPNGKGGDTGNGKAGDGSKTAPIAAVTNNSAIPEKARNKINTALKELEELFKVDESAAWAAVTVFKETTHKKLAKCGGRLANVKAATS